MELDLNELERLAKSATPGPWNRQDFYSSGNRYGVDGFDGNCVCTSFGPGCSGDFDFIAAANPAVVLELVRRLRDAEKDAARLDFLERNQLEADSAGDWNEEPTFGVHRVSGGRNDRSWHCLGRGETLRAAIDTAMQPPKNEP